MQNVGTLKLPETKASLVMFRFMHKFCELEAYGLTSHKLFSNNSCNVIFRIKVLKLDIFRDRVWV